MTLDLALRLTEILLGLALTQPSLEHLRASQAYERLLFAARLVLAGFLISGLAPLWACLGLMAVSLLILRRFQGPYNGGSDRMTLLILSCLTLAHIAPSEKWREIAFGYLAFQLVLSYFISGWVKIRNPDWRNGQALSDVFAFSAYPVSESLRCLSDKRQLLFTASWAVIVFELAFPFSLASPYTLIAALGVAAAFHFSNACFFGLNRFFWAWLAAYPSIIWLQERLVGG